MLHDYLHCLVFKEQSLSHSSEVPVASSDSFILSPAVQLVKNFFKFFFEAFRNSSVPHQSRLRYTVLCPCLSATCIILHESVPLVNTFFKLFSFSTKKEPLPPFYLKRAVPYQSIIYSVTVSPSRSLSKPLPQ